MYKVVISDTPWSGWFTLQFFCCPSLLLSVSLFQPCTLFFSGSPKHTTSDIIMCHVIVTCRSMLWTLLSIAAAFSELIAFLSTDWLVGFPRVPDSAPEAYGEAYRPTLGLFGRCVFVGRVMCGPYALTFNEIASGFWKAAAIFLATGILLLSAVAFTSIFTICFQSIMRKSIFNVCGLLQGIAGKINTCTHIHRHKCSNPEQNSLQFRNMCCLVHTFNTKYILYLDCLAFHAIPYKCISHVISIIEFWFGKQTFILKIHGLS